MDEGKEDKIFWCHGNKLLFWKNAGKSRVVEFEAEFLCQIYTNF